MESKRRIRKLSGWTIFPTRLDDSTSSHHKIAGNKTSFFFYAVKRNIYRFSEEFCFQLTEEEFQNLRFQIGTSKQNEEFRGGRRYLPYVFTEQGIAMLAGVLKNDIAVKVSINIIKSFIEMRKILAVNGRLFDRLTNVEYKLLEHDKKFDKVFDQLQNEENIKQKIFFEGQIYDAYSLIIDIIKKAIYNHITYRKKLKE